MFPFREPRFHFRGETSSKDTKIRVWNRETLELHRTLSGHQGPVNAIGLQNGFVVSASGDTKMMLWDIERGTCLRTFDGDRGLACIEFKVRVVCCSCNLRDVRSYKLAIDRTITSCPARAIVKSKYGMQLQGSVYVHSSGTTHSCAHLLSIPPRGVSSARVTTRPSRSGTFGLGGLCSSTSNTIWGISLTSSLMFIGLSGVLSPIFFDVI